MFFLRIGFAKSQQICNFETQNNTYKHTVKKLSYLVAPLGILLLGVILLYQRESEVLFRMQELSLFLPTKHFLNTSLIYPGGILTWGSAFMTQFFYHPLLGVCLLALSWFLVIVLSSLIFRLRDARLLLSALPPMALMAALLQTGYWIYCIKLQGYPWVPTMGVLASLCFLLPSLYNKVEKNSWLRLIYMGLVALIGYPLMGAWSFLPIAVLGFMRYEDDKRVSRIILALSAIALIALIPQIYYHWGYSQVEHRQIYLAAMPCFQYGASDLHEFRYAYYALALSFALLVLQSWIKRERRILTALIGIILIGIATVGVKARWYNDTNYHKEIAMLNAIERMDWEGVLKTMRSVDMGKQMPPTRLMVMMKNLALFRLGRIGDEMFHYPEGAEQYCLCGRHITTISTAAGDSITHQDKNTDHLICPVRITQSGGKMLYYFYGKEQFSYRWCMEDGVEFGWNVNVLKYMIKTSLVTEDWNVAKKYINMLKKTRYHKAWAAHYENFIHRRDLMEKDPEFASILPMANFPNRLDGDMTLVEMYLLRTFSTGMGADPYYQEMTLVCSMIMKDINLFWPRFHRYVVMHQQEENFRVPTHYQEAAYLFTMLEPQRESVMWPGLTNAQAAEKIPFDQSVKQRYAEFMQFNAQCGNMSEDQKKQAFLPRFGDTFFYFYFLVRNQKTN